MDEEELKKLKDNAIKQGIPTIRTESEKVLCSLASENRPNSILEFGTAVGLSAINLEKATGAKIVTIEKDEERAKTARINISKAGFENKIEVLVGDDFLISSKMVKTRERFDFVFLDSAKGQYVNLLDNIISLLNSGGVLVADNVLFRGFVEGETCPKRFKTIVKRLREFIDKCKNSSELTGVKILRIEDGLLVATKK